MYCGCKQITGVFLEVLWLLLFHLMLPNILLWFGKLDPIITYNSTNMSVVSFHRAGYLFSCTELWAKIMKAFLGWGMWLCEWEDCLSSFEMSSLLEGNSREEESDSVQDCDKDLQCWDGCETCGSAANRSLRVAAWWVQGSIPKANMKKALKKRDWRHGVL